MTNDAMTKAEARAYELAVQASNDWRAGLVQFFAFDLALIAYGDRRAVEAEIAALRRVGDALGNYVLVADWLADAEQRERGMG